jgi:acetyl-CoA acetyltransferase
MLRNQAIVAGVGESRIGKVPGVSALELCAEAARRALADAGLGLRDVDGLLTAYSMTAPYPVFYGALAEFMGLELRYGAELTAGGGSSGVMIRDAALAVMSGRAEAVLVVSGDNRATGMGRDNAVSALAAWGHPYYEYPYGGFIPAYYALIARRYMHETGATSEDLARVAVTQRAAACRHPNAHMRTPITIADVLASKPIAVPLNMLDCCLISDAAGALVVTRAGRAADLAQKPVYLLGAGEAFTHEHILAAPSLLESGAGRSAQAAYAMAGLGPRDIDLAMLYDCFTITPILLAEECGFAERGAGPGLWKDGHASIEGRFPINTHGGMLSHAHAGATGGLFETVEAVRQLRGGEGARQVARHEVALVHVEGGIMSNHATLIYGAQPA